MESSDEGSVNDERMHSDGAQSEEENEVEVDQKQNSENGSVASSPRSPAASEQAEQSDEEVHISNEESAASDDEVNSSKEDGRENEQNDSSDEGGGGESDCEEKNDDNQDDVEDGHDSDQEGSVPEIEIDSCDENNEEDTQNRTVDNSHSDSEHEFDKSEEKKSSVVDEDEVLSPPSSPKVVSDDEENSSPVRKKMPRSPSDEEGNSPVHKTMSRSPSDEEGNSPVRKATPRSSDAEGSSPVHKAMPRSPSDDEGSFPVRKKKIRSSSECDEDEHARKAESDNEEEKAVDEDVTPTKKSDEKVLRKSESDAEGDEHEKKNLIANIFGESDEERENKGDDDDVVRRKKKKRSRIAQSLSDSEDEETENKDHSEEKNRESEVEEGNENEADVSIEEQKEKPQKMAAQPVSDDDSDEDGTRKMREDFVSDFDLMMQKKKEENSKRRKRRDVDIINDSDDLIAEIIGQMRQAADEDRLLNKQKKTATKKLKILPLVMSQLKKQDLKMAFLDQGVLHVMADWLAPLPDRSLPNLKIREGMIKQLLEFPAIDPGHLKSSGVGRALMYLYKHPKETKENKEKAGKLITEWARPIFNVTTDYHSLTKEEREQRDFDHVPTKKRKVRDEIPEPEESPEKKDIEKALSQGDKALRPGDKGWVGRARVPLPSAKDYVVRPKWNVEMELGRAPSKKPLNRFEKHMRTLQEKKRNSKGQRAVTISIEGRKMAI